MKYILIPTLFLALFTCCKKENYDPVSTSSGSVLQWSSGDEIITSGSNLKLSFNNTFISLRDDQQNVHLVWQDSLFIKYGKLSSGSWSIISLPKIYGSGQVSKPTIGKDKSGNLFISWTESGGINVRSILISKSTDAGATWSAPYVVKTGNIETPLSMYVFNRSTTTGITLAWHDLTAQKSYVSTWNGNSWAANDWSASQSLNSVNSISHDATINGSGLTLYGAWEDDRSGQNEIYLSKSIDGGLHWSNEFPLKTGLGTVKGQDPSIGLATNGTLHIAWHNQNKIYYSKSTDPEVAGFSTPVMAGDGLFAHLAVNDRNIVAISWEHFTGSLTDDSGKSVGLLFSGDEMQTYDAPNVVPGSSTTFYAVQAAVNMSTQFLDVFWLDITDNYHKKLKFRYAKII